VTADVRRAVRLLVLPTIVLAVVAAFLPGRLEPGIRVYALLVCGLVLWLSIAALRRAFPPVGGLRAARRARRRRPEPTRSLAELENLAALGVADALDFHVRLRPRLHALAAGLLAGRRGIALDDEPDRARALLGAETWELVRRDAPSPDDRARGLSPAALERAVVSLERL
jgi:hypothetical protein